MACFVLLYLHFIETVCWVFSIPHLNKRNDSVLFSFLSIQKIDDSFTSIQTLSNLIRGIIKENDTKIKINLNRFSFLFESFSNGIILEVAFNPSC